MRRTKAATGLAGRRLDARIERSVHDSASNAAARRSKTPARFHVQFGEVKGATSYGVHGTGGNDPAYYHDEINLTYDPKNPPLGPQGEPLALAMGLSGGDGGGTDNSGLIGYFHSRFDGFTVTAYFS